MNLYLKHNYFTKLAWYKNEAIAKVTFPPSIIFNNKRPEEIRLYKLLDNKLLVNSVVNVHCPNYALRTLIHIDIFCNNIKCNIPRQEVYLLKNDKYTKFLTSDLDIDLDKEDLEKETMLIKIVAGTEKNKQALSNKFGVVEGFELVTSTINSGGLV